jgi:hypothetical protein
MALKNLTKNREFITQHIEELLRDYENKYLVIFEEKVIGSFDTYEKAAEEGINSLGFDKDFLIFHLTKREPVNLVMEAVL